MEGPLPGRRTGADGYAGYGDHGGYDGYSHYGGYGDYEEYGGYGGYTGADGYAGYAGYAQADGYGGGYATGYGYDYGYGYYPDPDPGGARADVLGERIPPDREELLARRAEPAGPNGGEGRPRRTKRRRLLRLGMALLAALLVTSLGTYAWAENKLDRQVDLDRWENRPAPGEGTNYLIVGSDSRDGLDETARKDLRTGTIGGRRTDSMILLHTGAHGSTMVSLPRDSLVTIPAFTRPSTGKRVGPAKNKLNAAFSLGGPALLARTIEQNTGLRIDHYAEIGFAGFVDIVNATGGVRMCLDRDIKDEKSGADLRKGCQTLDGTQALAFVRQRHQESEGDLGRTQNQQKLLSALASQAAEPDTALNPTTVYPALSAGLDTLIVDRDMNLRRLTSMLQAVRGVTGGEGRQLNVPTAGGVSTPHGSALRWDDKRADRLFDELREDRPVTDPERGRD